MQEKVYKTKIRDVGQLRQRIIQAWKEFDQAVIDAAIAQWRARLIASVEAEGEHFEYTLAYSKKTIYLVFIIFKLKYVCVLSKCTNYCKSYCCN